MIIWRYGITKWRADFTSLDQWYSERWMKKDGVADAPRALKEAIEKWLARLEKK
jgi:hypothetical protein